MALFNGISLLYIKIYFEGKPIINYYKYKD